MQKKIVYVLTKEHIILGIFTTKMRAHNALDENKTPELCEIRSYNLNEDYIR